MLITHKTICSSCFPGDRLTHEIVTFNSEGLRTANILKIDVSCAMTLVSHFLPGAPYCHDHNFIREASIHLAFISEWLLKKIIISKQISQFIQNERIVP